MDIIVYDFDKTIYGGETGTDFLIFYMKKKPLKVFLFGISFVKDILLFLFKKIKLKELKGSYFKFLSDESADEVEKLANEFWEKRASKVYGWVPNEIIENKKETDYVIVISASPLFLIDSFVKKLGFTHAFGTIMETEVRNGEKYYLPKVVGENCKNVEKVKVINKWAEKEGIKYKIIKFYSDSIMDKPLFDIAEKKYWIKKGKKIEGVPAKETIIDKIFQL
jgi:HAD superfamily hydrolase (TIGR01490 family)